MKKLVLAAFLIFILCGGAFEAAAAEYGAPKPARSFGTCTPCTGGIDDSLAPCDDWQYVSGQTGAGGTGDEDKAYTFEAVAGVNYIFSFCESGSSANYDSSLSIWDSACGAVLYACNDDWCGLSSRLSWTAPETGPYVLRVGGFAGSIGAYTLAYRAVELTCGGLTVSPRESAGFRGLQGGPFEPQAHGYTIRNEEAESSIAYRVSASEAWLSLDAGSGPSEGPLSGTLAPGGTVTVAVQAATEARALPTGSYVAEVSFENLSTGIGNTSRGIHLDVLDRDRPQLVVNGDFERGSFEAWLVRNNGSGQFTINDGSLDSEGPDGPIAPCEGARGAVSVQSGPGRHALVQELSLLPGFDVATLSWTDRIRNHAGVFQDPNQEFRVEVWNTRDEVLSQVYSTQPGDPALNECVSRAFDISAYAGQTIRIAFTEEDNLNYFNVHLDDIRLTLSRSAVEFGDFELEDLAVRLDESSTSGDGHRVTGRLMLGATSDGVDLLTEDVTLRVGPSEVSIPGGSFVREGTIYRWSGMVQSTRIDAAFEELEFRSFAFVIETSDVDLTGLRNPEDMSLRIGDDIGLKTERLNGNLGLGGGRVVIEPNRPESRGPNHASLGPSGGK